MRPTPTSTAILLALAAAACSSDTPAVGHAGGRFTLSGSIPRQAAKRFASAPATATWCPDDTSLAVVIVTSHGDGGAAARLHWPLSAMQTLVVGRRLGSVGTATVAWRPVEDSVRSAYVADSGQVRLEQGRRGSVSGSFTAWARVKDSTVMRLEGSLSGIPVETRCGNLR